MSIRTGPSTALSERARRRIPDHCRGSDGSGANYKVIAREQAGQDYFRQYRRDLLNCHDLAQYLLMTTPIATRERPWRQRLQFWLEESRRRSLDK